MPEWDVPMDGWLVVSVDGDQITKVGVESGEEVEIDLEARE